MGTNRKKCIDKLADDLIEIMKKRVVIEIKDWYTINPKYRTKKRLIKMIEDIK